MVRDFFKKQLLKFKIELSVLKEFKKVYWGWKGLIDALKYAY